MSDTMSLIRYILLTLCESVEKPCDWCVEHVFACIRQPIEALLAMKHRRAPKIDLYNCKHSKY